MIHTVYVVICDNNFSIVFGRPTFEHEAEVRVVAVDTRPDMVSNRVLELKFDPNAILDEVSFDPRLFKFERREREQWARELGCTGEFSRTGAYQYIMMFVKVRINPKQHENQ